jgi:hypothetical protein
MNICRNYQVPPAVTPIHILRLDATITALAQRGSLRQL